MTVDGQITDAGARLAAVPVAVPEIGLLLRRHHRRRRSLAAGGALAVVLLAGAVIVVSHADHRGDRVDAAAEAADAGPPAPGAIIGLGRGMGVWPDDTRRFATADQLGSAFATEVLGWEHAEVTVDPADPRSPTELTISRGPGRSVRAAAAPIEGAWTFMQIGTGSDMSGQVGLRNTTPMIPTGPPGTVSIRWWAMLNGREVTGVEPGPTGELVVPGPLEELGAVVVMYLDDHQTALDVIGAMFGVPPEATVPPSTNPDG